MTPLQIAHLLLEDTYKYATTDIAVEEHLADFIQDWGRLNVPEEALTDKGYEDEPHITVKYGLKAKELPPELVELVKNVAPFPIFLGVASLFTTNPDFDVVKIDVESPELRELNRLICAAVPHDDTYPGYHPHVTVAYVKKGSCDHLDGMDPFADQDVPREFTAAGMSFKPAGDSEDPARAPQMLLFSKTAKADRALAMAESLTEASKGFLIALRVDGLPHFVLERVIRPEQDKFGRFKFPFTSWLTAWQYSRPFTERSAMQWISRNVPTLKQHRVDAWALLPLEAIGDGNQFDDFSYSYDWKLLPEVHESVSGAVLMVERWKRDGLSQDEMRARLRSGHWDENMRLWHNRREFPGLFNQFVREAIGVIREESSTTSAVSGVDPFGGLSFPADPSRTKFYLRTGATRREERPIL